MRGGAIRSSTWDKPKLVGRVLRDLGCPSSVVIRDGLQRMNTDSLVLLQSFVQSLLEVGRNNGLSHVGWHLPLFDSDTHSPPVVAVLRRLRSRSTAIADNLQKMEPDELRAIADRITIIARQAEAKRWKRRWAKLGKGSVPNAER